MDYSKLSWVTRLVSVPKWYYEVAADPEALTASAVRTLARECERLVRTAVDAVGLPRTTERLQSGPMDADGSFWYCDAYGEMTLMYRVVFAVWSGGEQVVTIQDPPEGDVVPAVDFVIEDLAPMGRLKEHPDPRSEEVPWMDFVRCERCGWEGPTTALVGEVGNCPSCGSTWEVTEGPASPAPAYLPPVSERRLGRGWCAYCESPPGAECASGCNADEAPDDCPRCAAPAIWSSVSQVAVCTSAACRAAQEREASTERHGEGALWDLVPDEGE